MQVVVVGAGPAGCIAAETLALGGVRTVLIEKDIGRDKVCAGGIPSSVVEKFKIPDEIIERTFNIVHFIGPSLVRVPMRFPDGTYMATVNRQKFDAYLLERARAAKVIIVSGRFLEYEAGKDLKIRYRGDDGVTYTARADYIIGADGAMSRVSFNTFGRNLPQVASMQETFRLDPKALKHFYDRCEFYYAKRFSPDYYGWVFPHHETITLGVGTTYENADELENCLGELKSVNRHFLKEAEYIGRSSAVIPKAMYPTPGKDNILLVGDAAGFVLPGCGEGIFFAMESGYRAAKTILESPRKRYRDVFKVYAEGLKEDYGTIFDYFKKMERVAFKNDIHKETFVRILQDPALGTYVLRVFNTKMKEKRPLSWKLKTAVQMFMLRRLARRYIDSGPDIFPDE